MSFPSGKLHIERRGVWTVTVFLLICYYMLLPANLYHIETVQNTYYLCVVPVLVAAVFFFRRFCDGAEYKLLFAFWIWFWFSRALNGSPLLGQDFRVFFDLSLMMPFFAFGSAMTKAERVRFLDWLSAVIGGFYFSIGLIALVAFLHRSMYEIPALGGNIGIIREAGYARINFFDIHPNISAYWYLISLVLMIYQFFHCSKKLWRIPILLSAVLDLIVIAITYSRSVRLCMALLFGLLASILLLQVLYNKPSFLRMVLTLVVAAFVLVVSYEGSALCADAMATLSYEITDTRPASEAKAQSASPAEAVQAENHRSVHPMPLSSGRREVPKAVSLSSGLVQSDPRPRSGDLNDLSSNRIEIWRACFQAIDEMPSVLWRGQLCDDVMAITLRIMGPNVPGGAPPHLHNTLLQILMTTGLPGLLLAASFLMLVLYKGFLFLFCSRFPLDDRILVLSVLAALPHIMVESFLFTSTDLRTLFFFLMCGILIRVGNEYQKGSGKNVQRK